MSVDYYGMSFTYCNNQRLGIFIMSKRASNTPGARLTPREKQVADQIMKGHTNKEIAKTLGLRYETIKEHVQHILIKYGVPLTCPLQTSPRPERESGRLVATEGGHVDATREEVYSGADHREAA